jgi:DNA-binding phage protein
MELKRVNKPGTTEDRRRHAAIREQVEREKPSRRAAALARKEELIALRDAFLALKREREARGLTLTEVAERSGIDKSNLSKLENDPQPNPTLDTLSRIAQAIGVRLAISVVRS